MKITTLLLLSSAALLTITSCGTQSPSGFLDHYEQLQPVGDKQGGQMVYSNPTADFSKYNSIILPPVALSLPKNSNLTENDKAQLSAAMNTALWKELSKDYQIVTKPGPHTMRFRGALTELVPANRSANVISSVMPATRALSGLQQMTTGISSFSAHGSGEMEILDSISGERLLAISGTRYAQKKASESAASWGQMEDAMQRSAITIRKRLATERARKQ